MAKKVEKTEESKAVTILDERSVIEPLKIIPAVLIDDAVEVTKLEGLPEDFAGSEVMTGFPPSPKFERKGEAVFGEFVGVRTGIGPNNSRVYELATPNGNGESITIAVWGSTVLDRLFDSAYPPVQQGDKLAVIFLGTKETKRAQKPVKLFALKIKRMTIAG